MGMSHSEAGRLGYWKTADRIQQFIKNRHEDAVRRHGPLRCAGCSIQIPFEKRRHKFCSRSCAARTNNHSRKVDRKCEVCSKDLTTAQRRCCSQSCTNERRYSTFIRNWLTGSVSGGSWHHVNPYVKKWLIQMRGEKCELCGWDKKNPVTKKVPVQVDHANGDPQNHRPENLRLLCPNCHSLTTTFGGLNRGRGRKQRYARVG
jgi:hypothetical protein